MTTPKPDATYWRSPTLGDAKELELPQGRLRYFNTGSGPPIVFVHGALVNPNLWRKVVPRLAQDYRCVSLELPLGRTSTRCRIPTSARPDWPT